MTTDVRNCCDLYLRHSCIPDRQGGEEEENEGAQSRPRDRRLTGLPGGTVGHHVITPNRGGTHIGGIADFASKFAGGER